LTRSARAIAALAAVVAAWLPFAAARADTSLTARSGALETPRPPRPPTLFGGEGPRFVLYLRADGNLGSAGRAAIIAALGALARLPGAAVELFIEPTDRDAASLAEVLAELPGEGPRRALLLALLDQDLPRWADAGALARLAQRIGVSQNNGRMPPPTPPWLGGRLQPYFAAHASSTGRSWVRRPPGQLAPTQAYFASAGGPIERIPPGQIDELAAADRGPPDAPSAPRDIQHPAVGALGDPLAAHLVVIRAAAPLEGTARAALGVMRPLLESGRARLRLELDVDHIARANAPDPTPSPTPSPTMVATTEAAAHALLNRGLGAATQPQRLRLLWALLDEPGGVALTEVRAIWLLQAAGIDPVPLLGAPKATTTTATVAGAIPTVTLDGANVFPLELDRRLRPAGMRERLALPSRP
jgi:hypothetical protein